MMYIIYEMENQTVVPTALLTALQQLVGERATDVLLRVPGIRFSRKAFASSILRDSYWANLYPSHMRSYAVMR